MLIDLLNNYHIVLASGSPRRQQLFRELGLRFDVATNEEEGIYPDNLKGEKIAEFLAYEKIKKFRGKVAVNEIIITADTIVWCNNKVLNKPGDRNEAFDFLKTISDNTHDVITGVCLLSDSGERTFSETTKVTFNLLSDEEINYYIDNFCPFDKAGAYGIQEWIGMIGISHIEGSYFNVVGLPVCKLYKEIQEFILRK
jgi:septum formation protein